MAFVASNAFMSYLKENRLTYQDMRKLGYPDWTRRFLSVRKSHEERTCNRCNMKMGDGPCVYHWGRPLLGQQIYSCCNFTEGCSVAQCHVPKKSKSFSYDGFKSTGPCASRPTVLALDCEMVYTTEGLEVAQVSIVDVLGQPIYNKYVVPINPIVDFNTRFSGITKEHMKNAVSFTTMQAEVLSIIHRDTFIIGHALENDLIGIRICHTNIVDTSQVFAFSETRKASLKYLVSKCLKRQIQSGEHDSLEDAFACMELMLLKYKKVGLERVSSKPQVPSYKYYKFSCNRYLYKRRPMYQ